MREVPKIPSFHISLTYSFLARGIVGGNGERIKYHEHASNVE